MHTLQTMHVFPGSGQTFLTLLLHIIKFDTKRLKIVSIEKMMQIWVFKKSSAYQIESWWWELYNHFQKYFKENQLMRLLENSHNP